VSWDLNSNWKPDTTVSSEVEVKFTAEGPNATLVELEHRKFERLGAEGGAKMRKDVDRRLARPAGAVQASGRGLIRTDP